MALLQRLRNAARALINKPVLHTGAGDCEITTPFFRLTTPSQDQSHGLRYPVPSRLYRFELRQSDGTYEELLGVRRFSFDIRGGGAGVFAIEQHT